MNADRPGPTGAEVALVVLVLAFLAVVARALLGAMRHIWPWVFWAGICLMLGGYLVGFVIAAVAGRRLYAEWGQG